MKKLLFPLICIALVFGGCSYKDYYPASPDGDYALRDGGGDYIGGGGGEEGGGQQSEELAGRVTAGEWNDLQNWLFWSDLMTNPEATPAEADTIDEQIEYRSQDYTDKSGYWSMYTNNRVAVRIIDATGAPQAGVSVSLVRNESVIWKACTDNKGETNLWISPWQKEADAGNTELQLKAADEVLTDVAVTNWGEEPEFNLITLSATPITNVDIAFIVDATGSMTDEIDFLKQDLQSIIKKVQQQESAYTFRTAALFYRDEGDKYVTKESDFTDKLSTTISFIGKQEADGGGDYPEAVHTALEKGLQKLSWKESNTLKMAFLVLDAPPHYQDAVVESLQKSIKKYAEQGIQIIPVAASGVDKNTEFFLRFTAILTNGTYVFITNDSGIGNSHIRPTVGEYKVEALNDLLTRLILERI